MKTNDQQTLSINVDDLASSDELQQLSSQLEKLVTYHHLALREQEALADVETLQRWIESCQEGSQQAGRELYQQGITLLENVKGKLTLALQEQQRIIEESPTAAVNAHGRELERYTKANTRATEALCTLSSITEHCEPELPPQKRTAK